MSVKLAVAAGANGSYLASRPKEAEIHPTTQQFLLSCGARIFSSPHVDMAAQTGLILLILQQKEKSPRLTDGIISFLHFY